MKLDFKKETRRNQFKAYFMTEYQNGTSFIFSSFYKDDDEKNENIGSPCVFVLNIDLNFQTLF